jgi:hypothetical protein
VFDTETPDIAGVLIQITNLLDGTSESVQSQAGEKRESEKMI